MKLRLLMRLKETSLAAIGYAITMHGFFKVQTKDLFGLISDYINIIRLGMRTYHVDVIKLKREIVRQSFCYRNLTT